MQPSFTWDSEDDAIATVSGSGLATAEARGTVEITASAGGMTGGADLTVLGILHWTDDNAGTSAIPGGLTQLGLTATDATDGTDFVSLMQEGGWGLVLYAEQSNEQYTGSVATEINSYLTNGGKLLAATWVDGGLTATLEATRTGTNFASLTTDAHSIFGGLGASIVITNPGWGVYAQRYTANGAAVCVGSTSDGDCGAILGNLGNTLLLGPLFDAYDVLLEGETLVANAVAFLLDE